MLDLAPGPLFASIVLGSLGFGLFLYGKKQRRVPQLVAGIALMVFPYFVSSNVPLMLGIGAGLVAVMWSATYFGL